MNGEIDDVVTHVIHAAEIMVHPKTEIGDRAIDFFLLETIEGLDDGFPVEGPQMDRCVVDDVGFVVELPDAVQTVGVDEDEDKQKGYEGEGKLWA